MPLLTVVKTRMPRCIIAGPLASGTLRRAHFSSKHILNHAAGVLVFFNGTTNDDDVGFVWHRIASFQHAASLLAYRYTRNLRYEVSEDEHLQLLSGEGILHNKVPRKRKKCNKTNSVEFKPSLNGGKPTENVTRRVPSRELALTISGGFQQVDLMYEWRGASNTRHSKYKLFSLTVFNARFRSLYLCRLPL